MSAITSIQWADTTVNPIMGCGGCELFPSSREVISAIDLAVAEVGVKIDSKRIFKELVDESFLKSENPHHGHKQIVNTTNIWHLRGQFGERINKDHGKEASDAAMVAIRKAVTCYAATLHLNKGANILDRQGIRPGKDKPREVKAGYAPIFESVTRFEGRSDKTAKLKDLLGTSNSKTPWKERLPRMIFISDMGDSFSAKGDFQFLKNDLMPAIQSENGQRHLWLWLTKRPGRMAEFADGIGGLPTNVCAMTTLTGSDDKSLQRLSDLKKVRASIHGLSIEPLWTRIAPSKFNLKGINWVILGGESGSGKLTRPFALEWAEELRDHCQRQGVAFFMKQLGRNPSRNGQIFKLRDKHGGDWNEWEDSLRIREFPKAFHEHRSSEMPLLSNPRPYKKAKKSGNSQEIGTMMSPADKADFKRFDKVVRHGMGAFIECGKALSEIHNRKLWKVIPDTTWESYCREVAGMSKPHAHRLVEAARIAEELAESLPIGNDLMPVSESQIRPLQRLDSVEQRRKAWKVAVGKARGQPTAREVIEAVVEIIEPDRQQDDRPTRSQKRTELFERLKSVIQKRKSWADVELLLQELEELL